MKKSMGIRKMKTRINEPDPNQAKVIDYTINEIYKGCVL
jgi:hypothetical protein